VHPGCTWSRRKKRLTTACHRQPEGMISSRCTNISVGLQSFCNQHLGDALLSDAIGLCRHMYGNYVMQHLLIYGSDAHRSKFVSLLARHIHSVTADMTSLVVLNTALENCNGEQCLTLAWAICKSPRGLLVASAQRRRGHQLVKLVLETLTPGSAELESARAQLLSAESILSATRYGRSVLRCCQQETSEVNDEDGSPCSSRR